MENEINFIEYWRVIRKRKFVILLIVLLGTAATAVLTFRMPNVYKAQAVLMPVGGDKGGNLPVLVAQMGLEGMLGGLGGRSSSSQQLMTILKSRTFKERMIQNHGLLQVFYKNLWDERVKKWKTEDPKGVPKMEDAVNRLQSLVSFPDDADLVITINVRSEDPTFAADLANAYVKELTDYIKENAFTSSKRNRIFIERQLERNKTEMLEAGKELSAFYADNKISNVIPTVDVNVAVVNDPVLTVGRKSIPQGTFLDPPVLNDPQRKLEQVAAELAKAKVVHNVPQQVYLQYLILRRELLSQVNSLLTQQYEMAKINESKEDLSFDVIDLARVPIHKFGPQRKQIVMIAFLVFLLGALFLAFLLEYVDKMKAREQHAHQKLTLSKEAAKMGA